MNRAAILALFSIILLTTASETRFKIVHWDVAEIQSTLIVGIWILITSIARIVFHLFPACSSKVPESSLLLLLGLIIGLILLPFKNSGHYVPEAFNAHTFFIILLPAIVFDAGFFMPINAFFRNIGTILMYATVATIFNAFAIGGSLYGLHLLHWFKCSLPYLHAFLFGSIISAVDPVAVLAIFEEIHVNEDLYIIVFGESLLNDAVSVVLYNIFNDFSRLNNIILIDVVNGVCSFFVTSIGGIVIGVVFGLMTALLTKHTSRILIVEPVIVILLPYLCYLLADAVRLSGILAIVSAAMTMKSYIAENIAETSLVTVKYFSKVISNLSEAIIFLFLGIEAINGNLQWDAVFIVCLILFCLLYRSVGVVFFTLVVNHFRVSKIKPNEQFIMAYGGLRGAVAFSLVSLLDENVVESKSPMLSATICLIFFTVFLQGITIKPLVNCLKVMKRRETTMSMFEELNLRVIDHTMAAVEGIMGAKRNNYFKDKFEFINYSYIAPYLQREAPLTREKYLFKTNFSMNLQDAVTYLNELRIKGAKKPDQTVLPQKRQSDAEKAIERELGADGENEKYKIILRDKMMKPLYNRHYSIDFNAQAMHINRRKFGRNHSLRSESKMGTIDEED